MNAEALVADLRARGVHLELRGERIRYVVERPPIPSSALDEIAANRDALLQHLRSRERSTAGTDSDPTREITRDAATDLDSNVDRAVGGRVRTGGNVVPIWSCPSHGRVRPWRKRGNVDWNCPIHFEPQIDESLIEWMDDDGAGDRDA